jgi:hypothetical protein
MLADSMEVHNNDAAAAMFRKLMQYSEKHADEVHALASGMILPSIAPWDYNWNCPEFPEGGDCSDMVNYLMTARQALDIAMHNEVRGRDFYAWIARESPDTEVRRLAGEMAAEEQEHVDMLQAMLEHTDGSGEPPPEDLDPPNTPDG